MKFRHTALHKMHETIKAHFYVNIYCHAHVDIYVIFGFIFTNTNDLNTRGGYDVVFFFLTRYTRVNVNGHS